MRVKQFELLCALEEVVVQRDAAAPALDRPVLGLKLQVNQAIGLEHPSQDADVN